MESTSGRSERQLASRTPHELFAAYLAEQSVKDPRLEQLFAELLDEETSH